ncbi:hypothetical protein PHYSODRAFT_512348 [Phytophthora sojae]|uniref:Uncharacterized protein n=1 Tax=Phytophthora sojae (strain P6497) TaxID=1094619 RepID=G4ZSS1_PHYSP|nr:hypothetical protein PHYSODRAFT_512348 [Phytophthora sojae]EGZ12792.1 hypothetical protein PHYSODRAFT_512348 [Phytophthora sojae]|eukprot:XP_009530221.1 hypothetical protein PHYSODRAFT_512348 [Phytophthora sojae]
MMVLHALCGAFLLACAKLYWIMENKYLDYFATLLAPARDRHFRVVGTALGVLGAAHGLVFLNHLGASVYAGRLTVRPVNFGSDAYGRVFAARKTVEIATQIPNAYLYSTLIARPWINHVKVALLVTNCWSAFIIHRMLIKSESVDKRVAPSISSTSHQSVRFLAVVVDTFLSVATGILLPGAIIIPYMLVFDFKNLDFPDSLLYGDTSFANLILENRAFFAISWGNAVMKGVPHLSAFLCLMALASMLDSRLVRFVHRVVAPSIFLVTGITMLTLHLVAQFAPITGEMEVIRSFCLQRMHPWLAPNVSCAVIKYNCYREGVASPPVTALDLLERESVRSLMFLHCSELIIPPIIQEFSSLMGIELWNTTLVRWGEEAALSAQFHPRMIYMIFSFVNMTSLPVGILRPPLPEQLIDLEFIHTNLTTLPDEVGEAWINVQLVYMEHSQLNQFPTVLMTLPVLAELSLIDNRFETMPDDVLLTAASTYFYDLAFSKTPLRKLPEARSEDFYISYLALEYSQVTEIPAWIETNVWESVAVVLCGENDDTWDPLGEERYPTQYIEPSRSLDS